jgi:hypothetical protein
MNSNRKFKITHFDREDVKEFTIGLDVLIGIKSTPFKDTEMQYSLNEQLDEILDLKPFDRMTFLESRDDKNSLSIIIRVQ